MRSAVGEYTNVRLGSLAELHHTPKAAARAAGVGGIADYAIRGSRKPVTAFSVTAIDGMPTARVVITSMGIRRITQSLRNY